MIYPRFKCVLLHSDNSDNIDVSEYMTRDNSSISIKFQNGLRRTCQIEFYNDINHVLLANPNGIVWGNTKIKLYLGLDLDNNDKNVVYFPAGVYVLKEPQFTSSFSSQTITYDGVDLFGMFDDTIAGVLSNNFIIDGDTLLSTATVQLLTGVGDSIHPIISNTYKSTKLSSAQVKRVVGDKYSDIAGDIYKYQNYYYDQDGTFRVDDGIYDIDDSTKGSVFDFSTDNDYQYFGCIRTDTFDLLKNDVIVDGNNLSESNVTIRGEAQNNNPVSPFCINRLSINPASPKPRVKYISDNNITDNQTATQKAQWELKRCMIAARKYTLYVSYIPHLDVNQVVTLTDPNLDFDHERMLITQLDIPISTDSKITITGSSVNEIAFS